jgi:hypothetical protein
MTRWVIDPCRQLPIAGRNVAATDYAVDDSPDVLNEIVRARRQGRALSGEKIASYAETIRSTSSLARSRFLHDGALNRSCGAEKASLCSIF